MPTIFSKHSAVNFTLACTCAKPLRSIPLSYWFCTSVTEHRIQFSRLLSQILGILTEDSFESEKREGSGTLNLKEFYVQCGQRDVSATEENLGKTVSELAC